MAPWVARNLRDEAPPRLVGHGQLGEAAGQATVTQYERLDRLTQRLDRLGGSQERRSAGRTWSRASHHEQRAPRSHREEQQAVTPSREEPSHAARTRFPAFASPDSGQVITPAPAEQGGVRSRLVSSNCRRVVGKMNAVDSKARPWLVRVAMFAFATLALACCTAWLFGLASGGAVLALAFVALQFLDVLSLRAPTGQDHMTKNPGRGA